MLMDVFSGFDDKNFNSFYFGLYMWGFGLICCLLFYCTNIWNKSSVLSMMMNMMVAFSYGMVSRVSGRYFYGFNLIMCSLFMMLIFMNFSNCTPFFFPVTCHIPFAMLFGFSIWVSIVVSSAYNSWDQIIASLAPSGCPMVLAPFMVLVEMVSSLMRPFTLTMRMVFNLATGQVMLSLFSESGLWVFLSDYKGLFGLFSKWVLCIFVFIGVSGFYFFELCVSLLQSYIFCLLLCMYTEDHSGWDNH
uniref:ATP synthase subunit a n=1 Tax=Geukensia demissa TaxID=27807 RepID=A0A6B9VPE6_GEUDE|nr:ATP synthase F0 subunit 6 [Geukensia demissa]QHO63840.1 ATP synthase F0 subunit 6 [Geukensia demissa]UJM44208.1 ATP synthase F0 subunit 6 [Geukensia demissa]